jgi:hypothetical protein
MMMAVQGSYCAMWQTNGMCLTVYLSHSAMQLQCTHIWVLIIGTSVDADDVTK